MKAELVKVGGEGEIATRLSEQYRKAVSGLYDMVVFGAMMVTLDSRLTRETAHAGQRNQYTGGTLSAWLSEHCPDINYKTAMRFKALALALRHEAQIGVKADMVRLLTAPIEALSPVEAKYRRAADAVLEGTSARQLLFRFGSENGPGAPAGNQNARKMGTEPGGAYDAASLATINKFERALNALERIAADLRLIDRLTDPVLDAGTLRVNDVLQKLIAAGKARRRERRQS